MPNTQKEEQTSNSPPAPVEKPSSAGPTDKPVSKPVDNPPSKPVDDQAVS